MNRSLWAAKFEASQARHLRNKAWLGRMGWKVLTVWECFLVNKAKCAKALQKVLNFLERAREDGVPNLRQLEAVDRFC